MGLSHPGKSETEKMVYYKFKAGLLLFADDTELKWYKIIPPLNHLIPHRTQNFAGEVMAKLCYRTDAESQCERTLFFYKAV